MTPPESQRARVLVAREGDRFGYFGTEPELHVFVPSAAWAADAGQRAIARCSRSGRVTITKRQIIAPGLVCASCIDYTRPVT